MSWHDVSNGALHETIEEKEQNGEYWGFSGAIAAAEELGRRYLQGGAYVAGYHTLANIVCNAATEAQRRYAHASPYSLSKFLWWFRMTTMRSYAWINGVRLESACGVPSLRYADLSTKATMQALSTISSYDLELIGRIYLLHGKTQEAWQRFAIIKKRSIPETTHQVYFLTLVDMLECALAFPRDECPVFNEHEHRQLLQSYLGSGDIQRPVREAAYGRLIRLGGNWSLW